MAGFVFVLAVTLAARIYQPTGWLGSDDAGYYSAAEHILTGTPITRAHHHYARLAVVLPVALSVAVFGHHTWAVALPMFVASVLCVILVILLGRMLFGWREGLLAGLIVAVLPYFRVLSTTAYADTIECFWVVASVFGCVLALQATNQKSRSLLFLCCGFALAAGISAKVFAATAMCGLLALALHASWRTWKEFAIAAGAVALGGVAFFLFEGAFYSHFAGDFFFSLHAHEQSQTGVSGMVGESGEANLALGALIWDRMTLLMRPSVSGWGLVGAAFWPAVLISSVMRGAARSMALWAAGTFLLIAFAPVSLASGYQPYPLFHGRHILPACIPFALCAACVTIQMVNWAQVRRPASLWVPRLWPALLALIVGLGILDFDDLRGFRDRPTGRVGQAIREFVATVPWDDQRPIFLTPSAYWRYRIVFPPELRLRLRVAASADAPAWWKDVTPDIGQREATLPAPTDAWLIATPLELAGQPESWDYGVALPRENLQAWQNRPPTLVALRDQSRRVVLAPGATPRDDSVALLMGPCPLGSERTSLAASKNESGQPVP